MVLLEAGDKGAEFRHLFASFSKIYSIGVDLALPCYSQWQPAYSLPEQECDAAVFGRGKVCTCMRIEDSAKSSGT